MSYYTPIAYDLINYYPTGNVSPLGTAAKNKVFVVDSPVYPSVVLSDSSSVVASSVFLDPVIYSPASSYVIDSPLVATTVSYPDVNSDIELHDKITNRFYKKLYKNWLKDDLLGVLDFLKVSGKSVKTVKSKSKTKGRDIDKKIKFLSQIFTRSELRHFLKKFVRKSNYKWWDLEEKLYLVKKTLKKYLIKMIKNHK